MTGYKIYYGNYGYDCWCIPEWCCWYEYDNQVYLDKSYCETVMEDIKEQFPDREFEIYEVEVK